MTNEKLIEEAAKAIYEARVEESTCGDLARAALAVFEKAHTPTDDEREDEHQAQMIAFETAKLEARNSMRHDPHVWHEALEDALDKVLPAVWHAAAGFRRSEVPEPSAHRCEECETCGVHGASHLKCCGCYDGVCCQESEPQGMSDLIERSSLGTPEAQELRASVSDEKAQALVAEARRRSEPQGEPSDALSLDEVEWLLRAAQMVEHETEHPTVKAKLSALRAAGGAR
ncbi:hypothetical protein [Microbacterium algeriense]|uniref:hypothetical protein n=1 Tax=Microbacterium algeriense TaxID=2615184 RepID=UPI003D72ECFF